MSELRWILLGIGIVVIAAVYFLSRRKQAAPGGRVAPPHRPETEPYVGGWQAPPAERVEPRLDIPASAAPAEPDPQVAPAIAPDVAAPALEPERRAEPAPALAAEPARPPAATEEPEQLVLAINVVALTADGLSAATVVAALESAGLQLGRYGIYHCAGEGDATAAFSAANLVEPGRFPPADSDERVPGIVLFMTVPGPAQPQQALDAMLAAARRLAADLDAALEDARHKPFTAQAAQRLRERLGEFQARQPSLQPRPDASAFVDGD